MQTLIDPDNSWDALLSISHGLAKGDKEWMVPYNNSPFTQLLKIPFGGSCYTSVLFCLSPIDPYFEYNKMLLDLGPCINQIQNTPSVQINSITKMIRIYNFDNFIIIFRTTAIINQTIKREIRSFTARFLY